MPNGNDMSQDLTFEEQIKNFSNEGQFLARQVYEVCERLEAHSGRLDTLEGYDKKAFGLTGGLSAVLGGAIIAVINYFFQK